MYHQRSERLKWIALLALVLLVGGLVWYNRSGEHRTAWVNVQTKGVAQGVGQQPAQAKQPLSGDSGQAGGTSIPQDEEFRSSVKGDSSQGALKPVEQIVVHASGAVVKPGVYFLSANARVVDVVKAAGGVTGSADLNLINLAEPLADGVKVYIPYRGANGGVENSSGSAIVASGGAVSMHASSGSVSGTSSTSQRGGRVNINTATAEELETLPGIGPSKAATILQYRAERGRFKKAEDLLQISGIGEKTFAKLKDLITI